MSFLSDSQEGEPESRKPSAKARYLTIAVLLVAAVGATVYTLQRSGVDVRQAVNDARITSEDAATTAAVKTAFALSSKVSAFAIDVATDQGVVRLDGVVPSDTVKELAVAIAKDTSGVDAVEDRLTVEPATRPSPEIERLKSRIADLEIRADIDSALFRNPDVEGEEVRVSVTNRTVTLEGEVSTTKLSREIETLARSASHVEAVVNDLDVRHATDSASALGTINGDIPEPAKTVLTKKVRFELYATGAFNLDHMEVDGSDGVITLTGKVRSHAEKLLAERVVRDVDGVEAVSNELEVITIPFRASTTDVKRGIAYVLAQSGVL